MQSWAVRRSHGITVTCPVTQHQPSGGPTGMTPVDRAVESTGVFSMISRNPVRTPPPWYSCQRSHPILPDLSGVATRLPQLTENHSTFLHNYKKIR